MSQPDRTKLPIQRPRFDGTASRTLDGSVPDWNLIGGAGLIVAYPQSAAAQLEPAVTRAIKKVVGEAEGHHVAALKGAISEAQQKMAADGA